MLANVMRTCGIQSSIATAEKGMRVTMKKVLWLVGGIAAAAAGFLVLGRKRVQPVEELAHRLETAWADHHTTV